MKKCAKFVEMVYPLRDKIRKKSEKLKRIVLLQWESEQNMGMIDVIHRPVDETVFFRTL